MGKRKKYIESCQVSELKTYSLNGYPQKVLLEGRHSTSPVLIFLHGGPGSPIPFGAGSRGLFPEITDIVTSTKYIETFVKESRNKNLRFALAKNSGHIPGEDGMTYVMEKGFAFLCSDQ